MNLFFPRETLQRFEVGQRFTWYTFETAVTYIPRISAGHRVALRSRGLKDTPRTGEVLSIDRLSIGHVPQTERERFKRTHTDAALENCIILAIRIKVL